jgi:hypothetical protein
VSRQDYRGDVQGDITVEIDQSPIYQSLHPGWHDTATLRRPLQARGWFSNAWVMDGRADPRRGQRLTALQLENQRLESKGLDDGEPESNN